MVLLLLLNIVLHKKLLLICLLLLLLSLLLPTVLLLLSLLLTDSNVANTTYSLHCTSFLGLPFRILSIELVKPKKGTTMETIGKALSMSVWQDISGCGGRGLKRVCDVAASTSIQHP